MILDHRGDPVPAARIRMGFVPSEPVSPQSEAIDPPVYLASAIGYTLSVPDELYED
jgi:hypothetical protein